LHKCFKTFQHGVNSLWEVVTCYISLFHRMLTSYRPTRQCQASSLSELGTEKRGHCFMARYFEVLTISAPNFARINVISFLT